MLVKVSNSLEKTVFQDLEYTVVEIICLVCFFILLCFVYLDAEQKKLKSTSM